MYTPSWFSNEDILVSFAPTCGINKDGEELYLVDERTGRRTVMLNDRLKEDVDAVLAGQQTETIRWVRRSDVKNLGVVVPVYFDTRPAKRYRRAVQAHWPESQSKTLGRLIQEQLVTVRHGHGSPSADVRTGMVPYIKVSDLRAGQLNINPTNRVSLVVARVYWKGETSGLKPYDLLTPIRTSKNIGDIAILMPGQEQVVLTKEILVIRPGPRAHFDSFYLMWALMLSCVRVQWRRVIFMQTNREDVGLRYYDIEIPVAPDAGKCAELSEPFRNYYEGIAKLRTEFLEYLRTDDQHHVFLTAELPTVESEAGDDEEEDRLN